MEMIKRLEFWICVWATWMLAIVLLLVVPKVQISSTELTPKIQNGNADLLLQAPVIECTTEAQAHFSNPNDYTQTCVYKNEIVYPLSDDERELVESIVCGEAGNQPYWGKVAVASCILNACLKDDIRPGEVQTKYQYSGWKSLAEFESECMQAYGNIDLANEVRQAVSQVFDDGEVLSADVLWFYNPDYGYSSFHESQNYMVTIGEHRFFSERKE